MEIDNYHSEENINMTFGTDFVANHEFPIDQSGCESFIMEIQNLCIE